jgi:allantoicase
MTTTNAPAFLELPDLAVDSVGGAALLCNDEFFAEKEGMLRAHPAEWKEHLYNDRGKWMDGWETRRRREPGYDWCVVRLGLPGVIRGVVIDTAYFRGNYPESASLEACTIDEPLDVAALARAQWTELLPRSALAGDSKNCFAIAAERRFTHVRLNIFPDGGVARLRIHGEVVPSWNRLHAHGGLVDLAALANGAIVETCSDMFFGSRNNLIKPGPSRTMADGWETRRRRGPGNDWAIVRLCAPGIVERIELDTSHFKGNAPGRCMVEGIDVLPTPAGELAALDGWRPLLESPLQPHTVHVFEPELRRVGRVTYLRLSVFPDGGVARLRVWGRLEAPGDGVAARGLRQLGRIPEHEAHAALLRCCGSTAWAAAMTALRPFEDQAALLRAAEREYWKLGEEAWLEAFATHPRLGGRTGEVGDGAPGWSSQEQRGVAGAEEALLGELASANQAYLDRFDFVFLLCATGRSATEMLAELRRRISRPRDEELRTAAEEQLKITRLRLIKLVDELAARSEDLATVSEELP